MRLICFIGSRPERLSSKCKKIAGVRLRGICACFLHRDRAGLCHGGLLLAPPRVRGVSFPQRPAGIDGARGHAVPARRRIPGTPGPLAARCKVKPLSLGGLDRTRHSRRSRGRFHQGGAALRKAARVDRTFDPHWTLANYYFRRQNWDEFWKWIRAAAEISYGDRSALFGLCWRATSDPEMILTRAIPPHRPILAAYVSYLAHSEHFQAAPAAASRWLPLAGERRCSRSARVVRLAPRRRRPIRRMPCGSGTRRSSAGGCPISGWTRKPALRLPTQGSNTPRLSHGFDWRQPNPGVRAVWIESPPGLSIVLDGHQEEHTDLLTQWIPVLASSAYQLS